MSIDIESWNCPVCNRPHPQEGSVCMRCGADLASYEEAIKKHLRFLDQAERRLHALPHSSLRLAGRAMAIHKTEYACRMQALAALCAGNYNEALLHWRNQNNIRSGER